MTPKHWTKFLPEAGSIKQNGDEQERRLQKIADLKQQLKALQQEYKTVDQQIYQLATHPNYWTAEEVAKAKRKAAATK
ncbi:hypothetical protein ACS5NO_13920 [Larkinella sp. GY13]|uniref:hypothetical protein n=1 Tax=Larkinella sp. GY13 TaxID=3453720 RepID=UPI003EEC6A9E